MVLLFGEEGGVGCGVQISEMTGGCVVHGTGNTEEALHPSCFSASSSNFIRKLSALSSLPLGCFGESSLVSFCIVSLVL